MVKPKSKKRLVSKALVKLWKPNRINKAFWNKILIGRSIVQVEYNSKGVTALILDDGVHVETTGPSTFGVQVET